MYFSNWGLHFGQIDRNSKKASKVAHLTLLKVAHLTHLTLYHKHICLNIIKLTDKKILLISQKVGNLAT